MTKRYPLASIGLAALLAACSSSDDIAEQPVALAPIDYTVATATGGLTFSETNADAALVIVFNGGAPRAFDLTVTVTGDPADLAIGTQTLRVSAGTVQLAVPLQPVDDGLIEDDETIIVELKGSDSRFTGQSLALTLTSDDAPYVLTSDAITVTEPDRGGALSVLSLSLDREAIGDITLPFSVETTNLTVGEDFEPLQVSSITFADGRSTADIAITILGDDVSEDIGRLDLVFASTNEITVAPDQARATILVNDADPLPTITFEIAAQSASEAAGFARVRVTASPLSDADVETRVRIGGSAGQGTDYFIPDGFDRFIIPAGQSVASIDIELVNDGAPEGNETIILTLDPPTRGVLGEPSVHTLTVFGGIALNDTGVLARIGSSTTHPGQDADQGRDAVLGRSAFSFTRIDADGNPVPADATPGAWRCVRDNVTGLTWEAKSINLDATTGTETSFVIAESEPDFDIDADGTPDVNTQPAIGGDDWRAYNATYLWYSDDDATNGGQRGATGDFEGGDLTTAPGPQSQACGYRPDASSDRQRQADTLYQACLDAQANGTEQNPGPASCTRPIIDDGFPASGRSHSPNCDTTGYRNEMLFLNVCGMTGWRLPTIEELRGIVIYEDGQQGIARDLFYPFAPEGAAFEFWSADTVPARTEQGQAYCMNSAGVTLSCSKNILHSTLMVSE
jgi:hypothetical protein